MVKKEEEVTVEEPEPIPEPAPVDEELVKKTNEAAARLEKANADLKATLEQQKALAVEATLAGNAEAGKKKEEETPEEYAAKVMAGEVETKPE